MQLIIDITRAWGENSFHLRLMKCAGMTIAALIFGIPIRASNAQELRQPQLNIAYKIIAKHSGKCLEVENAGKQDWAQIIQNTYQGGKHQQWLFKPAGTHGNWPCYQIIAVHSGKCLEIPDAGMENHKLVMQNTWTGGNHQKWILRPVGRYDYEIIPVHSGKCVEVMGASQKDKFVVAQSDCQKQDHQLWKLEEVNPVLPSNSPIQAKYNELGRAKGFLGLPTTEERATPDGVGKFRHFEGGSIYWHPKTGAHEVHGDIRKKWSELGWEKSFLGYPTTDETATPDKVGRFNHFQGGSIYWHPKTGAHEVHGDIRKKWSELGWERSFLGYPTTDETAMPDKVGRFNHFQGGSIYWHPQTGARVEPHKPLGVPAPANEANLPNPKLTVVKREPYQAEGKYLIRFVLAVTNWQAFPDGLFAAAPHLPPCGLNKEASRTWVEIFDQNGKYLSGYCALSSAKSLENLWLTLERGGNMPEYVYIVLKDRQRDKIYKSNQVSLKP